MRTLWRTITDLAKRYDWPLKLADRLGRGRGRLRLVDALLPPPRATLKPDLSDWQSLDFAAVWVGHATVLLRLGGKTILTDPVFSARVGLDLCLFAVGPKRLQSPAVALRELPPIDLILLSHAHFDHLDRPSLARLPKRTPVIAATGLDDLIDDLGFRSVTPLAWGDTVDLAGLRVTAVPVRHWGARTFTDTHRGYTAFLLDTGRYRVLYGADTAVHDGWRHLRDIDLAVVGIGAYDPYIAAHASPEEALRMCDEIGARYVLPMHHKTFVLSREPIDEPITRLLAAAGDRADRIVVRDVGGMWTAPGSA